MFRSALAVVALICLAACSATDEEPTSPSTSASSPPSVPSPVQGLPDGVTLPEDEELTGLPGAAVYPQEGLLRIVTWGSSTNPEVARSATSEGQRVDVAISSDEGAPATMDFVPMTSAVTIPTEVSLEEPIIVVLDRWGEVTVDPAHPGQLVRVVEH